MKMTHLFRNTVKNPVPIILFLAIECVMIIFILGDINNMREAKNGYEYCTNLCYLVSNISIGYFMCIFFLIAYLTYINKQFSQWIIRLLYVLGISSLAYFVVAGHVYDYVFHHVENNYHERLTSLARTVFTGPVYWIIIGYFFIPKILKDAQKMRQEQELTI